MKPWSNKHHFVVGIIGFLTTISAAEADPLKVSCPHKDIYFRTEIATTREQQAKGLMFRTSLPPQAGMLFVQPQTPPSMWMKNTYIPLDMIFADEHGVIVRIFENTTPFSTDQIGPVQGTTQVFEVNAGISKKHGIKPGCVLKRLKKRRV